MGACQPLRAALSRAVALVRCGLVASATSRTNALILCVLATAFWYRSTPGHQRRPRHLWRHRRALCAPHRPLPHRQQPRIPRVDARDADPRRSVPRPWSELVPWAPHPGPVCLSMSRRRLGDAGEQRVGRDRVRRGGRVRWPVRALAAAPVRGHDHGHRRRLSCLPRCVPRHPSLLPMPRLLSMPRLLNTRIDVGYIQGSTMSSPPTFRPP